MSTKEVETIEAHNRQQRDYFEATIECIRDPDGFAVWVVPIWTARVA